MKASINGIAVSKLNTWNTDDGGGYQGDLLIDGKKVGSFHNDGNGGEVDVNIDASAQELFNQRYEAYYEAYPSEYPLSDMFVEELVNHTERLKFFKKNVKKGYTVFATCWKAPRAQTMIDDRYFNSPVEHMYVTEEVMLREIKEADYKDWQIFKSEEDFAINTDSAVAKGEM